MPSIAGLVSCQQEQMSRPLMQNPIERYGAEYRANLEEFRTLYPEAFSDFKDALIGSYAELPEEGISYEQLPLDLDRVVWKKLVKSASFKELPLDIRSSAFGCPYGLYVALWEEIAAETDTSDSAENLKRRKAICNLFNYELEISECGMPPGVQFYIAPHIEHANIVHIPHSTPELGMKGHTRYVRKENLSPRQQELVTWYLSAKTRIYQEYGSQSEELYNQLDTLLSDYYLRWKATRG